MAKETCLTRASYPIRDLDSYQLAYDKAKEVINDAHYSLDDDYLNLNSLASKDSQNWIFKYNMTCLENRQVIGEVFKTH